MAASLVLGARSAVSAELPMLDSKDPQAVAFGYVVEAGNADKAKFTKYVAGQMCANCQLYQGTQGSTSGPCPIFPGKQVVAKGWCSAYVKKV